MVTDNLSNPYRSPGESEHKPLSRLERSTLEFYLKHRDRRMSISGLYAHSMSYRTIRVLMFLPLIVLVFVFADFAIATTFITFLAGYAIGITLHEFFFFRRTAMFWPMLNRILKWSEVERQLD